MTSLNKANFLLSCDLNPMDYLSFNTIYAPLLGEDGVYLYLQLLNKNDLLNLLKVKEAQPLKNLLANMNWTFEKFDAVRKNLEVLGLMKTSLAPQQKTADLYFFELYKPLSIKSAVKDHVLMKFFQEKLHPECQQQIELINFLLSQSYHQNNHNKSFGAFDVSASWEDDKPSIQTTTNLSKANLVGEELKNRFYGLIYDTCKRSFIVSDEVYYILYLYVVQDPFISIEDFSYLAYKALVLKDGEYFICPKILDQKIQIQTAQKTTANKADYLQFWKQIPFWNEKRIIKEFKNLFEKIDTESFYYFLSKTKNLPKTFNKWVENCKKHDLTFSVMNLILSFTYVWCNRIPINYLNKISETIIGHEGELEKTFSHFKDVILYDVENGNNKLKIEMHDESELEANLTPMIKSKTTNTNQAKQTLELNEASKDLLGLLNDE